MIKDKKQENQLRNIIMIKRNKTYLKGQRGVRKYYDYEKLEELRFDDLKHKDKDRPTKSLFTENLRRQEFFAYLKYNCLLI